jgi:hypothetical protein
VGSGAERWVGTLVKSIASGHVASMSSKFTGDLQSLKERLRAAGIEGEWLERPNRVWQLRFPEGVGLNWSETRGTPLVRRKAGAKAGKREADC